MNQVRGSDERRDGGCGPRSIGSWLLTALFLVSGIVQQFQGVGSPPSQSQLCRHSDAPPASLPGETDPTKSSPLSEEETSVGRTLSNLDDILSIRPSRAGNGLRPRPTGILPRPMGESLAKALRTFQSEHVNPSPRASGRDLRHRLQSQTC